MILKKFTVGMLEVNCYIFGDEHTKEVVLIDPGGDPQPIREYIKGHDLKLKGIINTHGHGDHIGANKDFKVGVMIHESDKEFLRNADLNLSSSFGFDITSPAPSRTLKDGDRIRVGRLELEVIHTPGHSPGGISLRSDDIIFTGDTLFFEGVGRTDIPDASWKDLVSSITNRLYAFPDGYKVLPGHGPETTIGHEKRYNPFVAQRTENR